MTSLHMIGVTVKLNIDQNVETTYKWVADPNAALKFISGVKSYKLLDGDWKHVGARRRITLDTGATLLETIKTIKHSNHFCYELTDIRGISKITKNLFFRGSSQCWFRDSKDGGTCIIWRFSYQPRNLLIIPFLWLFMNTAYRTYMRAAMRKMKCFSTQQSAKPI